MRHVSGQAQNLRCFSPLRKASRVIEVCQELEDDCQALLKRTGVLPLVIMMDDAMEEVRLH